ncbi:uncharacterized protein PAC_02397 [Phialocephala subalpina]|uniref:Oxidase ustYa n=1 Tax=Phialocephala subalpina TaxID=576137 RepID=A0A1L7WID0_9HELO|nr:uncharacterized protein PAC_02397 [Phialocephala subalpina]
MQSSTSEEHQVPLMEDQDSEDEFIHSPQPKRRLPSCFNNIIVLRSIIAVLSIAVAISIFFQASPEMECVTTEEQYGFPSQNIIPQGITPLSVDSHKLTKALGNMVLRRFEEGFNYSDPEARSSNLNDLWPHNAAENDTQELLETPTPPPFPVPEKDMQEQEYTHMEHCFDYLRQSILCHGDSTLEGAVVYPDGKVNNVVDGMGVVHRCRDMEDVWTHYRVLGMGGDFAKN